jgi:hypothetical protein
MEERHHNGEWPCVWYRAHERLLTCVRACVPAWLAAVERIAAQMDTQRKEHAAQVETLAQQHAAETAEQQQALEQLRYQKEVAEATVAQKQQQLAASEAGPFLCLPRTRRWRDALGGAVCFR